MPLEPRFRRVSALHRRFVDREPVQEAFTNELRRRSDRPRVFNIVGVGGIGKSRLLRELRNGLGEGHRSAMLDLQVPAMRQQEDALAVLRMELGRQGTRFDRFDIAYAVLWQRLHPHLLLTRKELPFAEESGLLSQVLDDATGIPLFGTGMRLVKLAGSAARDAKRRRAIQQDETLRQLDYLSNSELLDAVTYLFAEDLRDACTQDNPASPTKPVILVDAYEAMVTNAHQLTPRDYSDSWLRDLAAQLYPGITVVASREPLNWHVHDREWNQVVRTVPLEGLPYESRIDLLSSCGITDKQKQHAIATASAGVPFYLHLAVDTSLMDPHGDTTEPVSEEEILQRFVRHVHADEIRTLELLSISRVFDFEIFQEIADRFDLPRHRLAWESLISYSFVYPSGSQGRSLHQLMRKALHKRLSQDTTRDVHQLLQHIWDRRTAAVGTRGGTTTHTRAIREAAYHGIHADSLDADHVLDYADRALRYGGKQAIDGITRDLHEILASVNTSDVTPRASELVDVARCLETESAIVLGHADRAVTLNSTQDWDLSRVSDARRAVATAHGRRIRGETAKSGEIYTSVWATHTGTARNLAGLWVADIHMWQGRFVDAFAIAGQVLDGCGEHDLVLCGDVVRLLHLGYRFALDFDAAERALEEAYDYYQRASAVVGLANLQTNRAELLAWTDPAAAVDIAMDAIDLQKEMGAQHELGKTYTALAIAQLQLGKHEQADGSFHAACDVLEKVRYRSGRARAELFRAFLHTARGDIDRAATSLSWAVSELEETEVYPTLIVMAAHAAREIGVAATTFPTAAEHARQRIKALDSLTALEARTTAFTRRLLGETR